MNVLMKLIFMLTLLAIVTGSLPALAENHDHDGPRCSLATMAGDWAFRGSGTVPLGDMINVGTLHADKDGTVTTHGWRNIGGTVFAEFTQTGTATVEPDCTGTQTWVGSPNIAKFVILDNGNEIWAVYDVPLLYTVILRRIRDHH